MIDVERWWWLAVMNSETAGRIKATCDAHGSGRNEQDVPYCVADSSSLCTLTRVPHPAAYTDEVCLPTNFMAWDDTEAELISLNDFYAETSLRCANTAPDSGSCF